MDPTEKTNDVSETQRATEPAGETQPEQRRSAVDLFESRLTVQLARGLVLTKAALEVLARWLDGRAKDVGELATKLSASADRTPTTEST